MTLGGNLRNVLVGILGIVAFLAVSGWQPRTSKSAAIPPHFPLSRVTEHVDFEGAQQRLSSAIQLPTVFVKDGNQSSAGPFADFRKFLAREYPITRMQLKWEIVNGASLLLEWMGTDPVSDSNLPILLLAHQDVVPVEAPDSWAIPPFSGAIQDGFIHGRGSLDMKGMLIGQLEAVEALLKAGYRPRRTIYLAFGHDEECSGNEGAHQIAKLLQKRGMRFEFVIDEGLPIAYGMFPGIKGPIGTVQCSVCVKRHLFTKLLLAFVGIAEKGITDVLIKSHTTGGHASMPFGDNAINVLAKALHRIASNPFPLTFASGPVSLLLAQMGDEHPSWVIRGALRNLKLTEILLKFLPPKAAPGLAAMSRTTCVATVAKGGMAANMLPQEAMANINCRILPGDSVNTVLKRLAKITGATILSSKAPNPSDPKTRLTIELQKHSRSSDPSALSSTQSDAYRILEGSIRHVFTEHHGKSKNSEDLLVAPSLLMGATDSSSYRNMTDNIFRFQPVLMQPSDPERIHGVDERIAIHDFNGMILFFATLIMNSNSY
ncbi:hypothetical protein DFS34DRAFT_644118 [Phlyctochytrium arcticum]|nr:hypothetical protein DFS34DRAFT_644118 [Phlyctochytrium arcticum]